MVVWKKKTLPILGGREKASIPKVHSDIEDLHIIQPNYYTNASYEGNTFLCLKILGVKPMDWQVLDEMQISEATINAPGWRYIPKVGGPGSDLSQPILYLHGAEIHSA